MVGLRGVEPRTSPLSGVRSDLLSYRPIAGLQFKNLSHIANKSIVYQLIRKRTHLGKVKSC